MHRDAIGCGGRGWREWYGAWHWPMVPTRPQLKRTSKQISSRISIFGHRCHKTSPACYLHLFPPSSCHTMRLLPSRSLRYGRRGKDIRVEYTTREEYRLWLTSASEAEASPVQIWCRQEVSPCGLHHHESTLFPSIGSLAVSSFLSRVRLEIWRARPSGLPKATPTKCVRPLVKGRQNFPFFPLLLHSSAS